MFLNVLGNDPRKSALHSLDNGAVADLATQDPFAIPEQSRLGAAISITASGQVAYSLNAGVAQGLAQGQTMVDSFLYAIKLSNGSLVWQTVRVTITGTNDAPIARTDVATALEDLIATGSVATNDSDVDQGAILQFATTGPLPAGFTMAGNGSWVLDATNPAYQGLGAGESQSVTITYVVTDEHGASSTASLSLTIVGSNDAPQVTQAVTGSALDGGMPVTLDALANASDVDEGATPAVVDVPQTHDMPAGVSYDPATHSFTLDPASYEHLAAGETATVVVHYGVSDGTVTIPESVSWTVSGANGAPVAQAGAAAVDEDQLISGQATAFDADHGAQLSFAADDVSGFQMTSDGRWTFDSTHSAYQSLRDGETIELVVPYTVADEYGASGSASITLTLTGGNDTPLVSEAVRGAAIEGDVSVSLSALANATDFDADNLSVVDVPDSSDLPDGVTYDQLSGTLTLDPSHGSFDRLGVGETAVVTVSYGVSDGLATTPASVSWTITGTNDGPVATPTFSAIAEDQILSGQLVAADVDSGATLSYALLDEGPEGFILNPDGSWSFDATGAIYQPAPQGFSGDWSLRYLVTDEHGDASESFLRFTLSGANDAPITFPAGAQVTEGSTVTGQLSAYDRDDGARLTFSLLNAPLPGFTFDTSGAWSLDSSSAAYAELAAGQTAILWVDYVVTDEFGASRQDVLGLEFTGINTAPIRVGPVATFADGLEDTPFTVTQQQLLAGWGDPERGVLTAVNVAALGAAVSANADGSFTITPDQNYSGSVNLSYLVSDGSLTTEATRELRFLPVNDSAVIGGNLAGSVTEATSASPGSPSTSGVVTISDPDGPAQFVAVEGAASAGGFGTVTLNQQGSWQYVLDNGNAAVNALSSGQVLVDSFTVTASDGRTRGVNITINGATDGVRHRPGIRGPATATISADLSPTARRPSKCGTLVPTTPWSGPTPTNVSIHSPAPTRFTHKAATTALTG